MPPSPKLLEFFVDRALGRRQIPDAMRALGFAVHTMFSVYGDREQDILDTEWLAEAGRREWIVLTKDDQIRRNTVELEALREFSVRVFCITKANLKAAEQIARFTANVDAIVKASAEKPPPFVFGVYEKEIRKIWPK